MDSALTIAGSAVALLIGIAALHVKVFRPIRRSYHSAKGRVSGALDNIGGRPEFIDDATGKTVPAIPPIGERFASIEEKLDGLANTDQRFDALDARVTANQLRLDDHDSTLSLIIGSTYERGSEATLKAVEQLRAHIDEETPG